MREFDPNAHITLNTNAGDFRMDRNNSSLFTHVSELAMYDHVFVQTAPENNEQFGTYIFRYNAAFEALRRFAIKNRFPVHLNANTVADCDRDAFNQALDRERMPDTIPDEWMAE